MSLNNQLVQEVADEAVYQALSLFIGQGRRYSTADIEAGIAGMKERTVASWIANSPENRRAPKTRDVLRIAQFLGERDGSILLSKIFGCAGFGAHCLHPQPHDPGVIVATLVAGVSEFATRAADQVYCHRDQGALESVADEMIATLLPFSAKGR